MSGGSVFVVLVVVLVVLEFWLVLDVEEVVVDLHPITHATNNAKTSAALWRGKSFIVVSFKSIQFGASAVYIISSERLVNETVSVYSWLLLAETSCRREKLTVSIVDITDCEPKSEQKNGERARRRGHGRHVHRFCFRSPWPVAHFQTCLDAGRSFARHYGRSEASFGRSRSASRWD